MKKITVIVLLLAISFGMRSYAQIGYQVSLLNSATGVPRANETVSVTVEITDSKDNVICSKTQDETTNDFGILSLSVGSENTFKNVDWNNLPMYISVTVDDILVGKSQVLTVPVAEHAKHYGTLTNEVFLKAAPSLSSTWEDGYERFSFTPDGSYAGTFTYSYSEKGYTSNDRGNYKIIGDFIYLEGDVDFDKTKGEYYRSLSLFLYVNGKLLEINNLTLHD